VNGITLRVHLCADTLTALTGYIGDLTSIFKSPSLEKYALIFAPFFGIAHSDSTDHQRLARRLPLPSFIIHLNKTRWVIVLDDAA